MRKTVFWALFGLLCQVAFAQRGGGHGGGGMGPGRAGGGHGGNSSAGGWGHGGQHGGGQGGGRWTGGTPSGGAGTRAPAPGIYSYTPNTYGSASGFGNVVFPGTGHAPGTYSPFSIVDPTFGTRLSNTVSGFGYGYPYSYGYSNGYGYGYGHYGQATGSIVVPYAVPVYVPYPEPQPPPPPQVIYIVPGDPQRSVITSAPSVTYVVPPRNTDATPSAATADKRLYLIALKNHSIYSATEYWMEGDTLHYLTSYGAHNQVTLDQVDLEFTTQLNRERGMEFRLDK